MDEQTRLLTVDEVVERLGKSRDYWLRKARARQVPHVRIGRDVKFTEADVAAIVAASRVAVSAADVDPLLAAVPQRSPAA